MLWRAHHIINRKTTFDFLGKRKIALIASTVINILSIVGVFTLGLNFGIHDAMELTGLLGRVIRREAPPEVLDLYDRSRRPLNIEFVQQQTIANKKRMEEKDPAARARSAEQLRQTAADPAAHRAYLLRASLIESVRRRASACWNSS